MRGPRHWVILLKIHYSRKDPAPVPASEPQQDSIKGKKMTESTDTQYLLEVRGDNPLQIREDLNGAVDRAIAHAMKIGRHGVLVTQHSYTLYTVALSNDVPYGQILERRLEPSDQTASPLPAPAVQGD